MDAGAVVREYYAAQSSGDLDRFEAVLDEDVLLWSDGKWRQGRGALRALADEVHRAFPGVVADGHVLTERDGCVVCAVEYRNERPDEQQWDLGGLACEVFEVHAGRVTRIVNYFLPGPADRSEAAAIPDRMESSKLADERAMLADIAELVADGVSDEQLFTVVARSVARLARTEFAALLRFEADDTIRLLSVFGPTEAPVPLGERRPLNPELRELRRTGRPLRLDTLDRPAPFIEEGRSLGVQAAVGVPVAVNGQVWGVAFVSSTRPDPLPSDTETRLTRFGELVAIALANAEARHELRRLAEAQVALRRVAELVARGAPLPELASLTAREAGTVLGSEAVHVLQAAGPGMLTPIAGHGDAALTPPVVTLAEALGDGHGVQRSPDGRALMAPVRVEGRFWGVLSAAGQSLREEAGIRLAQFADLLAVAVSNAERRAELRASRARVVATADETRRRMQRDLHDGAQQRLVQTVLTLQLALDAFDRDPEAARLFMTEALEHAERGRTALHDMVHGLLPAALSHHGLAAGCAALLEGLSVPVRLSADVPRLPEDVETTAYFIVAEAITNVVKHSGATSAEVELSVREGALVAVVADDGRGGADPGVGSGLNGLFDRVGARDGRLRIDSPGGQGTRVEAVIPLP